MIADCGFRIAELQMWDVRCEMWDCGMRIVELQMWDVRCEMWDCGMRIVDFGLMKGARYKVQGTGQDKKYFPLRLLTPSCANLRAAVLLFERTHRYCVSLV